MSSSNQQAIDPRGTLQNMLNEGFSLRAAVSERIDNALDAKASKMKIKLDSKTKDVLFIDNGLGMSKEQSKTARRINHRKEKSNTLHGRFGKGGSQSDVYLSELQTTSSSISNGPDGLVEINIDWKECVKENCYNPVPQKITVDGNKIWYENAIDLNKSGSIFQVRCTDERFQALKSETETTRIRDSLIYHLGLTYSESLNNGFSLTIVIDGKEYSITAVKPLTPSNIKGTNHQNVQVHVFKNNNTGQTRAFYLENGSMGYRSFDSTRKSGRRVKSNIPTSDDKEWTKIGELCLESTYTSRDDLIGLIDLTKYDSPKQNEKWNQEDREYLYGKMFKRNGKMIMRTDIKDPKAGDKSAYKFTTDSSHIISFTADFDDYFDIQTNKSRVETANFNPEISKTLDYLISEFSSKLAKANKSTSVTTTTTASTTSSDSEYDLESLSDSQIETEDETNEINIQDQPQPVPKPQVSAPAPAPAPKPVTPIVPIQPPAPQHSYTFGSIDNFVIVNKNGVEISRVKFVGQFYKTRDYLNEVLTSVGQQRFEEWFPKHIEACNLL